MKYRVECYRTMKADYGEFVIEAPDRYEAFRLAQEHLTVHYPEIEWSHGDGIDDVGVSEITAIF